jgi:hypothetical protein
MNLPESITLKVVDARTGMAVREILFGVRVQAGRKNDYHILFPKTDVNGEACLVSDDFRGQFEDHWESGLMDYDGSVSSANPVVTLYLFDVGRYRAMSERILAWPLLKNEGGKWKSRKEKFEYISSCRNAEFRSFETQVNLEENRRIEIKIK